MRKIEKRSIFCLILAALLGLGLAFFCFQFVVDGGNTIQEYKGAPEFYY